MRCAAALLLRAVGAAALPPYPTVRFTPWGGLSPQDRHGANAVGYQAKSWNRPGTLAAEASRHAALEPAMAAFLGIASIDAASWDCYVNHYRAYNWTELGEEARTSYATLGWTPDAWGNGTEPAEEGKYWADLTAEQRHAAAKVCYVQPSWDDVAIPLWKEDDGAGGEEGEEDAEDPYSAQEDEVAEEKQDLYEQMYDGDADPGETAAFDGPASAHNDRGIAVPFFRYEPWDLLDPALKTIAQRARYDEKSWNAVGTHKLERVDWDTIGRDAPDVQRALLELGFSKEQWDCYMLHYRTYSWGELEDAGVKQFFKDLGYTHAHWDRGKEPDSFGMYWPDLKVAQQNALYQVGYFRELWDEGEDNFDFALFSRQGNGGSLGVLSGPLAEQARR